MSSVKRIQFYTGGPFTISSLKKILDEVLKQSNIKKPGHEKTQLLAHVLNDVCGAYRLAQAAARNSRADAKVREAFETLMLFFQERRIECEEKHNAIPSQIIEAEQNLYNKFFDLFTAMANHNFQLSGDVGVEAALMPELKNWRDIALAIAASFRIAMEGSGAILGLSNEGPVPRFVARVIPMITGEQPSVGNVGKHLKDIARSRRNGDGEPPFTSRDNCAE